jgi:sugar (pentulose or hexulose) kinase
MSGIALGIDLGTSGVRAAVIDAAGEPVVFATTPLDGVARRDAAALWGAVQTTLGKLGALGAIRGVAVDGTSGTLVAIDAGGSPRAPAELYNDPAAPALVARIAALAPGESAAHGAASPLAKLLALRARPGVARVLHEADWIAGRLRGAFDVTDENNALKTGYDPVARRWPDWFAALGLGPDDLPRVVPPGSALGPVGPEGRALGLDPAALVIAGTTDGCAAFLATGAAAAGDAVTSLGSTLTIKLLSSRPVFAPHYGIYSHRLGEMWLAGGASNAGGAVLAAYFDPARLAALSAAIDPSVPSGLDYYPLLRPGERFPISDPALAPRLTPRPAEDARFLHGMLEGLARVEALGYQRLGELGASALASIRAVGGGAANPTFTAIRARLLGVPFRPARASEAAVGAARLALAA